MQRAITLADNLARPVLGAALFIRCDLNILYTAIQRTILNRNSVLGVPRSRSHLHPRSTLFTHTRYQWAIRRAALPQLLHSALGILRCRPASQPRLCVFSLVNPVNSAIASSRPDCCPLSPWPWNLRVRIDHTPDVLLALSRASSAPFPLCNICHHKRNSDHFSACPKAG